MNKLSPVGAALIGIGAIVGGGIFVLGGVAVSAAGPAATLAFLFSGIVALLTARSYAHLSRIFPESGGTYVYAKRILSVRAAFVVGWMLWLAHIVAALLYALGFAAYFTSALIHILRPFVPQAEEFLDSKIMLVLLGAGACVAYTSLALKKFVSDGKFENYFKLILFFVLILFGVGYSLSADSAVYTKAFESFFPNGWMGVVAAMGYTFIAMQGFELIAAQAGNIENPKKVVPRAMYVALGIALVIYIPLLLMTVTIGTPEGILAHDWCADRAETCIADSAEVYLGPIGFWLVTVAAIFATLSALQANLIASANVAFSMARDRTLPRFLSNLRREGGVPEVALFANLLILLVLLLVLPNAAQAGSAASLAFLICFALAHGLTVLAEYRRPSSKKSVLDMLARRLPILAGTACILLALFQIWVEQSSGAILVVWVSIGAFLYYVFLSKRAETIDAFSQATDPGLFLYRGQANRVLLPVANIDTLPGLVSVAKALVAKHSGKLLLMSIVSSEAEEAELDAQIGAASNIIKESLRQVAADTSFSVEGAITFSSDPWTGIASAFRANRCDTLLMGFSGEDSRLPRRRIGALFQSLRANVVIVRAPQGWELSQAQKVIVPIAGKSEHELLRARILGRLVASGLSDVTFLRVLPRSVSSSSAKRVRRSLEQEVADETLGKGKALVEIGPDIKASISKHTDKNTLVILGIGSQGSEKEHLGALVTSITLENPGATLIIRLGEQ